LIKELRIRFARIESREQMSNDPNFREHNTKTLDWAKKAPNMESQIKRIAMSEKSPRPILEQPQKARKALVTSNGL